MNTRSTAFLICKMNLPLDETQIEAFVIVGFDKFIEIDTQTFAGDTKVIAENKVVCHANIMMLIFWILDWQHVSKEE